MASRTPLYDVHVAAGGRMVEFAGYQLPVQFDGLMAEHRRVRSCCGLFDVSHMGEVEILGGAALEATQWLVCGDVARLLDGQALYTGMLNPRGGFVDDLIVYRIAAEHYLLCVNAANRAVDFSWIQDQLSQRFAGAGVTATDRSEAYAQIAVQGPAAEVILGAVCSRPVMAESLSFFHHMEAEVCGHPARVARTGYTGEDGFELFLAPAAAPEVWAGLLEAGRAQGIGPAGLGARDTLRLEAKLALYGNDIDAEHSPLEAGLGWIVALDKPAFCGRDALLAQKAAGVARKLVGFEMVDRGIPRHGYPIVDAAGDPVGVITSGSQSPTLEKAVALGYVPRGQTGIGREHLVSIRGKALTMRIVRTPFYRHS